MLRLAPSVAGTPQAACGIGQQRFIDDRDVILSFAETMLDTETKKKQLSFSKHLVFRK